MKIMYENCGVKNYMKEDHHSYRRNFCNLHKRFFVSQVRWTWHFLLSVNTCGRRWVEEPEQWTRNAWLNFTWNHVPPSLSRYTPWDLQYFFYWRSIPHRWARRKRQFPTPELLIDDHMYIFCYIFLIRTKGKWHIFTTFMNVFLSLSRVFSWVYR